MTNPTDRKPDLLPCPFCGSQEINAIGSDVSCAVWCMDCGANNEGQKPRHYLHLFIEHWNKRTPSAHEEQRRALTEKVVEAAKAVSSCCALAENSEWETRCDGHYALDAALDEFEQREGK